MKLLRCTLTLLIITLLAICNSYSQNLSIYDDEQDEDLYYEKKLRNELKINLAYILFGYIEASYERILPSNSSVGLVMGKSFERDVDINYGLLVYYRLFFDRHGDKGFFIEVNSALWNEPTHWRRSNHGVSHGAGVAVGGKFFRGKRFHGECVFGIGSAFIDNNYTFEGVYPRFAISIGYRF